MASYTATPFTQVLNKTGTVLRKIPKSANAESPACLLWGLEGVKHRAVWMATAAQNETACGCELRLSWDQIPVGLPQTR